MNWKSLQLSSQLNDIIAESETKPVLIFKHSTRCSISSSALNRVERVWDDSASTKITPYYLDLINFRDISNDVANRFNVEHQSPQVLLIYKGKSIFDASHMAINLPEIISQANFAQ